MAVQVVLPKTFEENNSAERTNYALGEDKWNIMHIKKGDTVVLLTGDDKGKKGKIVRMMPKDGRAIVEGLNMRKKHQKPRKEGAKGQVIEIAMPIRVSNLALADKPKKK